MIIEKVRPAQVIESDRYERCGCDCGCESYKKHSDSKVNAALTLGIIGTAAAALDLFGHGNHRLFGDSNMPENININGGLMNHSAPSTFDVWEKECNDKIELTNNMWNLYTNGLNRDAAHREVDVAEKFGLYKSQVDGDFNTYKFADNEVKALNQRINNELFSLYKYTRDKDDDTRKELSDLKMQVAVNTAIRPYQDKLIQCEIEKAYTAGINYTDRKTCKAIYGQVVLPNSPEVVGYGSYCCYNGQTPTCGKKNM